MSAGQDGSRKRILFVSHTADWTGPTNSLLLLLTHLRKRYEVAVLLAGQGLFTDALSDGQIPFFAFAALNKRAMPAIIGLIKRERFDLVYANNTSRISRNGVIAARLLGVPCICHARGMGWDKSWWQLGYLRLCEAVIAISEACGSSVAKFARPGRLRVVYNGVPLDADTRPCRQDARAYLERQADLPPDCFAIVSVSHISPRKGITYAIEAMADVVKHEPRARLVLVGSLDRDAEYVAKVRAQITESRLDHHVFLLGFRQDVMSLISGADLLIHTAVAEPQGRSVLEAMAAGLPVAAFSVDGVAETVVDGQTGVLVPKEDAAGLSQAIVSLIGDSGRRESMGSLGRRRVEESFSAKATAEGVAAIIDEVLDARKRRTRRRAAFLQ